MKRNVSNSGKRIQAAVLHALGYYSIFRFPLKAEEIYNKIPLWCPFSKLLVILEDLTESAQIFKYNGYYSIEPDVKTMVMKRMVANN
jgi:hypothetical protein